MILAATIVALTALFILREWQHTREKGQSADTANATINLLFSQLDASREREAAAFKVVIDQQEKAIKEQQKTIAALHSRLSMPAESAAADLNEQYEAMKQPVASGATTPAQQELTRLEDVDWAGVMAPDLNDLDVPQPVPVEEQPIDL